MPTPRKPARMCWRVPDLEDAVLFNAAYTSGFIPHSHDAITVLIVTAGSVELSFGTKTYLATKGDMAIVGAHQIHSARPLTPDGWRMRSIHLPSALVAEFLGAPPADCARTYFSQPVQSGLAISSTFLDLHSSAEYLAVTQCDLRAFVRDLYRNIDTYGPVDRDCYFVDDRVTAAQRFLTDPDKEAMKIGEIAEELGLSIFALIRQFERAFGLTPCAWRMQARANEAARLLRERKQAAEAALLSGFSDQSHMARTFKKVYGITPGQYSMMHA